MEEEHLYPRGDAWLTNIFKRPQTPFVRDARPYSNRPARMALHKARKPALIGPHSLCRFAGCFSGCSFSLSRVRLFMADTCCFALLARPPDASASPSAG